MTQTLQQIRVLWGEILRVSAVHQDLAFRGSVNLKTKNQWLSIATLFWFVVATKR